MANTTTRQKLLLGQQFCRTMSPTGLKQSLEGIGRDVVDTPTADGTTLLQYCSLLGSYQCAEVLIELGACVDAAHEATTPPVIIASSNGHSRVVKLLLEKGANPNVLMKDGANAILNAVAHGFSEVVDVLCQHGADVNYLRQSDGCTPLLAALRGKFLDVVRVLLQHGAKEDVPGQLFPPVLLATEQSLDALRMLLDAGFSIEATAKNGLWPLLVAVRSGKYDTVGFLVERGADVNRSHRENEFPLAQALRYGPKMMKLLHTPKLNLMQRTECDEAWPLMTAARMGLLDCMEWLLDVGCPINECRKSDQATAHTMAAIHGQVAAMNLLRRRGADINFQTAEGKTALYYAIVSKKTDNVVNLLAAGAKVSPVRDKTVADGRATAPYIKLALQQPMKELLEQGPELLTSKSEEAAVVHCSRLLRASRPTPTSTILRKKGSTDGTGPTTARRGIRLFAHFSSPSTPYTYLSQFHG